MPAPSIEVELSTCGCGRVRRLFEGGDSNTKTWEKVADYSRMATVTLRPGRRWLTIRGRQLFEGGDSNTKTWEKVADYSRVATIRGWRLIEEIR